MAGKDNVRRFTFRIHLTDGRYLDVIRECDRPIPPDPMWVLNDQREIYTAAVNQGWARVITIDGSYRTVNVDHIVSIDIIDIAEGIDINAIRERYNLKG